MKNNFSWKLNESNFSFIDRLKIARFFLNSKNFWTMNGMVSKFEKAMAKFANVKHAIYVSNGSTANTCLSYYIKDNFCTETRNVIILPSTTWITSVSPFIRDGMQPHFIDISLDNLSMDLDQLESFLRENHSKVACVFITSLLGFSPDIQRIEDLQNQFGVKIMMDNCENTFSTYQGQNVSSFCTSTTSTYFGHQLQSVEGGFIFTNSDDERDQFLMYRNHGMVRSVADPSKFHNKLVDIKFDFNLLGNNFRNTDINAFIGLLDLKRVEVYKHKRNALYDYFYSLLDDDTIWKVKTPKDHHYFAFCIPLIFKNENHKKIISDYCESHGIETRPIISGNLLRQTALSSFGNYQEFKNSEYVDTHGVYVGLHNKVKKTDIESLANAINNL